ncbi:DEAD/DEAH box helicase [Pimelobacter simplex]|uniref:DEAD/DEAH box helicase n=1 Tax=Nocardioides simplex TaxID=2045 RepID=UPI0019345591|nr:DEAD/DEAH box helicase [Pimelobacter simplex]
MNRQERQHVRAVADQVATWSETATQLLNDRRAVEGAGSNASGELLRRLQASSRSQTAPWRFIPLIPADGDLVAALARARAMPAPTKQTARFLDQVSSPRIKGAVVDARSVLGAKRFFSGSQRKDAATEATATLTSVHRSVGDSDALPEIDRLQAWLTSPRKPFNASAVLSPEVGFVGMLPAGAEVIDRRSFQAAERALAAIDGAQRNEQDFRKKVIAWADAVRQAEARRMVQEMPVERLRDATSGQLRTGALASAGIRTVQQVLSHGDRILGLPGVGATTGTRMLGAARAIWKTTLDEMPVRIDFKNRGAEASNLVMAMRAWDAVRSISRQTTLLAAADQLRPIITSLGAETTFLVVVPNKQAVQQLKEQLAVLEAGGAVLTPDSSPSAGDPWDDFLSRPADYFAMLSELGFLADGDDKSQGDLPTEIVEAIRELKLETTHLKASLRGYQSFGARFAIVQRKVIIGDEMGLGKTVESLAVLTHLRARGSHHFLVVCPAAVVTNWVREVRTKSDLRAHRLHGPGRDGSLTSWIRNGGVAITTYDSLGWLEGQIPDKAQPACLVFDEAHYVKNPDAQRTRRSLALIRRCERAILLTGTPLENRIEEFRNLVGYLRPDLTVNASEFAPRQFRKQVAPAYLRRNQEDVLTELPELVEVDEWMPMSKADEEHYRSAVMSGNFMGMRQAALRAGQQSQKMQRLLDIVEEAEDNERRVLVFSHFRDVLDEVAAILPGKVFGPLTGSVPAAKRQQMVDDFSAAGHGAVLVAQIVAGGVGLNIQAASVVVICEPQLKPTTEWQAIARSRRMGQLESVQVHRLLSEEGVDLRITEILAKKSELFAEFARVSETAESAPEAYDISDAEVAREIVASERQRLMTSPS